MCFSRVIVLLLVFLFQNCIAWQNGHLSLTITENRGSYLVDHAQVPPSDRRKRGQSCAFTILGLVALGDASSELAAERAGLKEIHSITQEWKTQVLFFQEFCTVVRGV